VLKVIVECDESTSGALMAVTEVI